MISSSVNAPDDIHLLWLFEGVGRCLSMPAANGDGREADAIAANDQILIQEIFSNG
jgi:hypothetical protein